ncbi:hypothetical protein OG444_01165 [Streptomyces sp. NBC_01232]|uniref:hypothetical protein n=1 Tax=Streptomyces sp. NBC_01232 TaxID=2903786 RepID=UPI002E114672|nr:hypothetical protein OG444_01165 [Streptomyces sp. NBC_01232]
MASSRASAPSGETGIPSRSPEDCNEGLTAFHCSRFATAIKPELAELAAVPDVSDDERGRG